MGHSYVPRNPRGQQRDKIYREALRLELADMSEGVDLKKLRQIARAHIEKAAAGDAQAIKELADRLDGRPAQILEHSGPDSEPITKIVNEIVHVHETREEILAAEECGSGTRERSWLASCSLRLMPAFSSRHPIKN